MLRPNEPARPHVSIHVPLIVQVLTPTIVFESSSNNRPKQPEAYWFFLQNIFYICAFYSSLCK